MIRNLKISDVIKDENIGSPSVELESSPLTQSNTLHRLPQFRSVTKSEETGTLYNDDMYT